jgi:hypothetical protein
VHCPRRHRERSGDTEQEDAAIKQLAKRQAIDEAAFAAYRTRRQAALALDAPLSPRTVGKPNGDASGRSEAANQRQQPHNCPDNPATGGQ